jgi:hypothetical protein
LFIVQANGIINNSNWLVTKACKPCEIQNRKALISCFNPSPKKTSCTVNVDCVKFEYVVLAKYHHMLIFEFDLLTKQHILILCKKLL